MPDQDFPQTGYLKNVHTGIAIVSVCKSSDTLDPFDLPGLRWRLSGECTTCPNQWSEVNIRKHWVPCA